MILSVPSIPSKVPTMTRFAEVQEARDFLAANPDIRRVHLLFMDMTGIFRGKAIQAHELEAAYLDGRPLPTSTLAMTMRGVDVEDAGLLWKSATAIARCALSRELLSAVLG